MSPRIIYEDDEVQVVYRPGQHPGTLVAFSPTLYKGEGPDFWVASPADRLDLNVVNFTPKRKNYFPPLSISRAREACEAVLRPPIVLYGASMGGYAAVKYGGLFKGAGTIAFSPQFSVNPQNAPFDKARHLYYIDKYHADMSPNTQDLSDNCVIFFDPYHPVDCEHARLFAEQGAILAPFPFAGHDTISIMSETKSFGEVFELSSVGFAHIAAQLLYRRRRQSKTYLANLGRHLARKKHATAASNVLEMAIANGYDRAVASCMQAEELYRHGKMLKAAELAKRSLGEISARTTADAMSAAAEILFKAQDFKPAIWAYRAALNKDPRAQKYIMGLTAALDRLGLYETVVGEIENILQYLPHEPQIWGRLGWTHLKLERHEKAAECFARAIQLDASIGHLHEGAALARRLVSELEQQTAK
jgi:tetratricopeptide (TPR) repeat protein